MESNDKKKSYTFRFLARVIIEAVTPLSVGSGEKGFMSDHLVARDVNGLPYILGTAVAGIVRHAIDSDKAEKFFGCNMTEEEKKKQGRPRGRKGQKESSGEGSQIIFSSAQLVYNKAGEVVDGLLLNQRKEKIDCLKFFENLPVRQHVRIDERGTSVKGGKFDEEVVFKGTRFCFEIEMLSETQKNVKIFDEVITHLASDTICIGSGTRTGHGVFEIKECLYAVLDLNNKEHREAYIGKTTSLNDPFWKENGFGNDKVDDYKGKDEKWVTYQLALKPDDFFLFGSGFGNEKADMTPVMEEVISWETDSAPTLIKDCVLIPGSSVKGAFSHRVAFHYNKLKNIFVDVITRGLEKDAIQSKILEHVGCQNIAVRTLFGYTSENEKLAERGSVLISDVMLRREKEHTKILNHVSIDRFTGGAIDGFLFAEEVTYGNDETFTLTFKVHEEALIDNDIKQAFENALIDIASGMLPLGGGINRGHGCFTGKILKNGKEIYKYE